MGLLFVIWRMVLRLNMTFACWPGAEKDRDRDRQRQRETETETERERERDGQRQTESILYIADAAGREMCVLGVCVDWKPGTEPSIAARIVVKALLLQLHLRYWWVAAVHFIHSFSLASPATKWIAGRGRVVGPVGMVFCYVLRVSISVQAGLYLYNAILSSLLS